MGIDAGDLFGRGQEDVVITNLAGRCRLYLCQRERWIKDRSYESGIALATRRSTGFGVAMLDYDNDGRLDLLMVNGGVTVVERHGKDRLPLGNPNFCFVAMATGLLEAFHQSCRSCLFPLGGTVAARRSAI